MATFSYNIQTIPNFDDNAATQAAMDVQGAAGWELISIVYQPNEETGKSIATVVYKKTS